MFFKFEFDPQDLITPPSISGTSKSAGNQKIVVQDINSITTSNTAATYTSSTLFNRYGRWADSLSAGEGISSFNILLRSDLINTSRWGQQLRSTDWNNPGTFQATAGEGWNYRIVSLNESAVGLTPGPGDYGYTIQWWTADDTRRLNGKTNMTGFSFTASVECFDGTTGESWAVEDGMGYTVWFGTQNRPSDTTSTEGLLQPISFDATWDNLPSDTFASGENTVFNGSIILTAQGVPEPSCHALLLLGIGALASCRRKRGV